MQYTQTYISPLGRILLASDGDALTGLWFEGQKYYAAALGPAHEERDLPVLDEAKKWLDLYFTGTEPGFTPKLVMRTTPFRKLVWETLLTIPYGQTRTYGEVAALAAARGGLASVAPRAVGGAVGHNAISLIVPCHRVVGADGSFTGYAGGLDRKVRLLELEKADMTGLHRP